MKTRQLVCNFLCSGKPCISVISTCVSNAIGAPFHLKSEKQVYVKPWLPFCLDSLIGHYLTQHLSRHFPLAATLVGVSVVTEQQASEARPFHIRELRAGGCRLLVPRPSNGRTDTKPTAEFLGDSWYLPPIVCFSPNYLLRETDRHKLSIK